MHSLLWEVVSGSTEVEPLLDWYVSPVHHVSSRLNVEGVTVPITVVMVTVPITVVMVTVPITVVRVIQ